MSSAQSPSPQPLAANPQLVRRAPRLGEMLIERRQIEPEDLDRALELQKERGDKIGKILVDMGSIAQRDVLSALSQQLGIPSTTLEAPPPATPEIQGLPPPSLRQRPLV